MLIIPLGINIGFSAYMENPMLMGGVPLPVVIG